MSKMSDHLVNKVYPGGKDSSKAPRRRKYKIQYEDALKKLPSKKENWEYWGTQLKYGRMCHVFKNKHSGIIFTTPAY